MSWSSKDEQSGAGVAEALVREQHVQRDRGGKGSGVGGPEWVAVAGALGVLWEGGRCRHTERAAAAQLRVLAEDQMALLVSALVPLLSYSDARREAHGVANKAGTLGSDRHGLKS